MTPLVVASVFWDKKEKTLLDALARARKVQDPTLCRELIDTIVEIQTQLVELHRSLLEGQRHEREEGPIPA